MATACFTSLGTLQPACGATTGPAGLAAPVSNAQPSLAMNYIIRLSGLSSQLGEVVPFAGSFVPAGWARADGQLLVIDDNADLFQRLGTTYGGNGVTTFALPDLRGRTAIHRGAGAGLTDRPLGSAVGADDTVLALANMPAHAHQMPGGGATGSTGVPVQSFLNMQPSLAMNYAVSLFGDFPSPSVATAPPWYGQVRLFAGAIAPAGYASADGQLLPINQNQSLFSILTTRYGGNGVVTFALPDLRGRAPVHVGSAGGGTNHALASAFGSETVTLTPNQLPGHAHTLPAPAGMTVPEGDGDPFNNAQPSSALNYIICTQGNFPSPGLGATEPFLGQVGLFAGDFAPRNWAFAEGQILTIAQNTSLFAILGTTYGGNGITTFALPDLRGRTVVGAGAGVGLDERSAGEVFGLENQPLTESQLPPHAHAFTNFNADFDGDNDVDGSDFLAWQQNLGASPNATHAQGDANFDGDVDAFDLSVWTTQFGSPPPPPATPVPEPMSLPLLWLAMVSTAIGARCKKPPAPSPWRRGLGRGGGASRRAAIEPLSGAPHLFQAPLH